MPEARAIEVWAVELDVDEVPLPRPLIALPGPVAVGISISIGPRRHAGDVVRREIVAIGGEHRANLSSRRRLQVLFSDEGDDVMTLIAPGCSPRWQESQAQQDGEDGSL
jgi:hypothetical protein